MKTVMIKETAAKTLVVAALMSLCGCNAMSRWLNPFYEEPTAQAYYGERSDKALNGSDKKEDTARKALETMGSYQRAHAPQPVNPVVQPAVIRLMWIPDHLNKSGDLVPAHYYYVKVLSDRFAATDAFELESQLGSTTGGSGNYPYVYGDRK